VSRRGGDPQHRRDVDGNRPALGLRANQGRSLMAVPAPHFRHGPRAPEHLLALGIAGVVGFAGNEVAAGVRLGAAWR